jgi:ABC-2 type transport system ATP-binding protein
MIEIETLTKRFGLKTAVDGISFRVGQGEVLGFLGPNGAGKSTTMRMITGYVPPTSGSVRVGGIEITESPVAVRKLLGYLPENAPAYPDMTVDGFLGFVAEIRGYSGSEKQRKVRETLESCFLVEVHRQTIGSLSKGYKQRVCFAQSVLHDPPCLIMDEPTDGLDPNQKHIVRGMIRKMSESKTIILSTHILEEVDVVCNRVIVIDSGRIIADDTPDRLRARSPAHGTVKLVIGCIPEPGVLENLENLPGVRSMEFSSNGGRTEVAFLPSDPLVSPVGKITQFLCERNIPVQSLHVEDGRLEEVFRAITTQRA